MKRRFISFIILLVISVSVTGQNPEYGTYMDAAGKRSLIYSGRTVKKYRFMYQGTPFAYGPDYEKGTVIYNHIRYENILLNLNSHFEEVYVKSDDASQPVSLISEYVSSFTMGGKSFVRIVHTPEDDLPETGFYEIVSVTDGILYRKISKEFREQLNNEPDRMYYFNEKIMYYLYKDGKYSRIKKKKELGKYLK